MREAAPSVLVVDDDLGDRKLIRRLLRNGFPAASVTEAQTVDIAQDLLASGRFDVVLLDYLMPGADGIASLKRLKQTNADPAYVMVTGQGDEAIAAAAFKLGAVDYIAKRQLSEATVERLVSHALETLHLQQQLDTKVAELQSFAHVLVHDIRTPIRHVKFLCEELREALEGDMPEEAIGYAAHIEGAFGRIDLLIQALSQHILIDGGLQTAPVEAEDVLRDTLLDLTHLISERQARITSDPLPVVLADRGQLSRLFQNLIANAVKFCRHRTPEVHVSVRAESDGLCRFSIRDNGIGIAAEDVGVIFDAFRRLHSQDEFEGSGLGLATCAKIVEKHGGTIWCESVPGDGSVFHFTLPDGHSDAGEQDAVPLNRRRA